VADNSIRYKDHDGWLLSFTPEEKEAFLRVKLFLAAIGRLHNTRSCQAGLSRENAHKYFPIFAKEMGWTAPFLKHFLYEDSAGSCHAVFLYLRDDRPLKKGSFYMPMLVWSMDMEDPWRFDESPEKEKALEAARVVMNMILPDWKW
jgi:hypothetical protein